jgi:holo-[acyl-carrier protein] synthase
VIEVAAMPVALGIGVDLITISRMREILETSGRVFIEKVFTPREKQRAETHPDRVAYLAMTFAAKEAIFKTFGIGWETGVQFKEIEIQDGEHGEPLPVLTGRFAELAAERGVSRVLLSLSYDGDYAVAVAGLSG